MNDEYDSWGYPVYRNPLQRLWDRIKPKTEEEKLDEFIYGNQGSRDSKFQNDENLIFLDHSATHILRYKKGLTFLLISALVASVMASGNITTPKIKSGTSKPNQVNVTIDSIIEEDLRPSLPQMTRIAPPLVENTGESELELFNYQKEIDLNQCLMEVNQEMKFYIEMAYEIPCDILYQSQNITFVHNGVEINTIADFMTLVGSQSKVLDFLEEYIVISENYRSNPQIDAKERYQYYSLLINAIFDNGLIENQPGKNAVLAMLLQHDLDDIMLGTEAENEFETVQNPSSSYYLSDGAAKFGMLMMTIYNAAHPGWINMPKVHSFNENLIDEAVQMGLIEISSPFAFYQNTEFYFPVDIYLQGRKYGQSITYQENLANGQNIHTGVDLLGELGDPIYAIASGKIVHIGEMHFPDPAGRGPFAVVIEHDANLGIYSIYSHNSAIPDEINVGDYVEGGQTIAYMGDLGYGDVVHLHLEIIQGAQFDENNRYGLAHFTNKLDANIMMAYVDPISVINGALDRLNYVDYPGDYVDHVNN